ncbi:hypothetical protein BCR37DRAFT_167880 [Protomyces lactucae-debilis]|uniref:Uncharacterized protein n=1 Tax=Protomyces lactucae-debilis TaxID=2754530 RepID=A0A1Y2EWU4_PROLT|nr:uncharacterized protein BCR37DRAFT_167880 [Protomyces lactucae-debilis]ORY76053.1 hypothetical protein BCR37DRAFT_167880 [Protomyces lactucae-debilis]
MQNTMIGAESRVSECDDHQRPKRIDKRSVDVPWSQLTSFFIHNLNELCLLNSSLKRDRITFPSVEAKVPVVKRGSRPEISLLMDSEGDSGRAGVMLISPTSLFMLCVLCMLTGIQERQIERECETTRWDLSSMDLFIESCLACYWSFYYG